jgi:hypothetical protein
MPCEALCHDTASVYHRCTVAPCVMPPYRHITLQSLPLNGLCPDNQECKRQIFYAVFSAFMFFLHAVLDLNYPHCLSSRKRLEILHLYKGCQ